MADHSQAAHAHQFDDIKQQHEADSLGMWVFLTTEILFFGALFLCYGIYRHAYPDAFASASHYMDVILGGINTAVLLGSSLTVVLAVHAAQHGERKRLLVFLVMTIVLGCVFLGIKGLEYSHKFAEHLVPGVDFQYAGPQPGAAEIYFVLYFVMTGIHALHLLIGIGIMTWLAVGASRNRYGPDYYAPVEVSGLYWHFVDIIWIFLYPMIYLIHVYR
ncbi:MAG TPA: cytochrome c oxidase subunit 3 family protein [Bacteroidota bacterium]|nr:cytochrome c oxidase subunit 3 family protein [Bacteroidota bacterium]